MTSASVVRDAVEALLAGPQPMPIVQAGDPVLRAVAEPYDGQLDDGLLAELLVAMRATMHAAPGVGLAAPQVGLGLAIAVVEDQWPLDDETALARERTPVPFRVLVNPSYEAVGDERVGHYEGCLSVDGWQAVRSRWRSVRLRCLDERGAEVDEVLHGWPARIVQHETDHLLGRLYVDHAEMRSLVAPTNALRWTDPTPHRAAQALGFDLP
ncbi:peptide deformylase [Cellulomonas carbonis]|uniref:Peptide deformylase n=1 Tax=Cellulomonas carbonis T26 TaxID=947969 RepID=A0A0A0BN20_9CELL|nr:peptide deformylase [Cellulomonas carbonis]KGM09351.1 peptide deformylase [Cellulomonas carbonis T26]GGC10183.1 peptide deformylase 1 [Cellulomonas carbonis]